MHACCVMNKFVQVFDMVCHVMQMSRQWMYNVDRRSKEFIDGVHYFLSVAEANKRDGFMRCPCFIIPGASPPPLPPQRYVRLDREEPIRHLPS